MELDEAIKKRKSTRSFSDKKPDWRDIIECIDAARYAPMAGDIYSLKIILVDEKEKIKKLADASQQDFIAEAHYVVVFCSNPSMTLNAYGERGEMYLKQQAGAAIQNFLLKIEEKGLATCWIGYFVDRIVKEILKIPEDIEVEAFFPVGYESKVIGGKKQKKRKIDIDNILYFNKYKNKKMNPQKTIYT